MNTNQHTPVNSSATVANNYLARSLRQLQSTTFLHCPNTHENHQHLATGLYRYDRITSGRHRDTAMFKI